MAIQKRSAKIRKKVALFNEQKGRCFYCDGKLLHPASCSSHKEELNSRSRKFATLDHVIVKSKGGPNTLANFVLACAYCNADRGDTEFMEYLYTVRIGRKITNKIEKGLKSCLLSWYRIFPPRVKFTKTLIWWSACLTAARMKQNTLAA